MFVKDTRTESFLSQIGVEYHFVDDLKIEDLSDGWDTINDGRPVSLRDDAVLDYGCLMEAGSPAPAVIVHKTERGSLSVLDGLQRLAAAKAVGFTRFSAYIVASESGDTLMAIRVTVNARLQGHAESPEWTKRNAVQRLIVERGMSPKDVSAMGGWRTPDLIRLAEVLDWGFQIRCIGGPQSLSDGIVQRVASKTTKKELQRASKPIAAFLDSLVKARFSTSDAEPHIDDFFEPAAKVAAYDERLKEFLNTPEVDTRLHGRMSSGLSVDVNLRRSLRTAVGILDGAIEEGDKLQYVDEFFQIIKQIDRRLHTLAPRRKTANTPQVPADKWA